MVWNIPNIITIIRLFAAILFVPVYFYEQSAGVPHYIALSLYIFASVTDVIDGYIARKYKLITEFGKLFDPIADKLLQFLVVVCIAFHDNIYIFLAAFIFVKEIVMAIGTYKLYKDKMVVSANIYGKIASVLYFVLFFAIIGFKEYIPHFYEIALQIVFITSSLFAFINYYRQYFNLKKHKN